ncbi:MAG: hypothetical protein HY680_04245 [Chloroflexi bacterium]|nr:hypothetical protein [Chloroflexota bacterium]
MDMQIIALPKSALGWWSVGSGVAWIPFFALSVVLTGLEVLGPGSNRPLAVALTIVLVGIATVAFVAGLISVFKSNERSVLVFVATAIGLYGLIGGVGSLLGLAD